MGPEPPADHAGLLRSTPPPPGRLPRRGRDAVGQQLPDTPPLLPQSRPPPRPPPLPLPPASAHGGLAQAGMDGAEVIQEADQIHQPRQAGCLAGEPPAPPPQRRQPGPEGG